MVRTVRFVCISHLEEKLAGVRVVRSALAPAIDQYAGAAIFMPVPLQ